MDDMEARTAAFMAIWTADCIEFTEEFEPEPLLNQKVHIHINTLYVMFIMPKMHKTLKLFIR